MNLGDGRAGLEGISAAALDGGRCVFGMDVVLHGSLWSRGPSVEGRFASTVSDRDYYSRYSNGKLGNIGGLVAKRQADKGLPPLTALSRRANFAPPRKSALVQARASCEALGVTLQHASPAQILTRVT